MKRRLDFGAFTVKENLLLRTPVAKSVIFIGFSDMTLLANLMQIPFIRFPGGTAMYHLFVWFENRYGLQNEPVPAFRQVEN